jgi:spore germination cell wall hydrolase CwlJ-like protein
MSRKELKRRIEIFLVCCAIQLTWIAPIGIRVHMDNMNAAEKERTESTSETVEQTETEEVFIEESTSDIVLMPEETETETEVDIETEVETEVSTEVEKTYIVEWDGYELTEDEFALICTTVFCEAGGEGFKEKYMVALTILNQITSGKFGSTVEKVIYRENNFAVTNWKDFENCGWTKSVEEAVLLALEENDHPRDMYYFRTGHYHKWAKDYKKVGKIYFSTDK